MSHHTTRLRTKHLALMTKLTRLKTAAAHLALMKKSQVRNPFKTASCQIVMDSRHTGGVFDGLDKGLGRG